MSTLQNEIQENLSPDAVQEILNRLRVKSEGVDAEVEGEIDWLAEQLSSLLGE